ncbi:MAG: Asp23/Gls24 family envelope stress response protein [Clostridiales bacterium]|uniref:Asp23/Gls24 family envelope stress response protein n=1 Tax=Candidatus Scybalenecus merdavium TaxID=2840939 RepID=A0A9D1MVK0_9FIRM|nr:Asp23/Gls24 family envelope stress response protein [Clostridiales bacterium]HIU69505.1 Asp23/Gls24 family envelope stress response protein [Candidatus Scubalenecus merdavium]
MIKNLKQRGRICSIMEIKSNTNLGELVISEDVLVSIAINAAKDVEGVSSLSTKPLDVVETIRKGSLKLTSPVRIKDNISDIEVSIYVNMKPGYKIVSVAEEIQTSVKDAIVTMTGKAVSKVNVIIAGIDFETESVAEEPTETEE